MGRRFYSDIVIRGVTWPTVRAAAAAHGVQIQTIHKAIRAGTLDRVGTGCARQPMACRINGVVWPSAAAAAAALGCRVATIYTALSRGTEDRVMRPRRCAVAEAVRIPVVLGGVRFASMRQASLALGFSEGHVSQVLRRGTCGAREALLAAVMRYAAAGAANRADAA